MLREEISSESQKVAPEDIKDKDGFFNTQTKQQHT